MKRLIRSGIGYGVGLLLACGVTPAAAMERGGAGCEQLAALVDAEVDAAIGRQLFGTAQPRRWPGVVISGTFACGTTAAVASSAFSQSFERYSLSIGWNNPGSGEPGDACLSHYLEQCYPDPKRGPIAPLSPGFVHEAWSGVQVAIRQQMPFGVGSDWTVFREAELSRSLAVSLEMALDGPRRERPPLLPISGPPQF